MHVHLANMCMCLYSSTCYLTHLNDQGDLTKQKAAMDGDMVYAILGKIYNSQFGFSFFNLPLRFPRFCSNHYTNLI